MNNNSVYVSISNIVVRNDKYNLRGIAVNSHLNYLYIQKNIFFIDHTKTVKSQHLNKSELCLNKTASSILRVDFIKEMSNIFQQCIIESYIKAFLKLMNLILSLIMCLLKMN